MITAILSGSSLPLVLLVAAYLVSTWMQTRHAIQRLKRQHGCQEPPRYPHKDPIFGSDLFNDSAKHAKQFKLLDRWSTRYKKHGKTFAAIMQGTPAICTIDPTNLLAITTTNFNDYGVQPMRRDATLPFLGEGVFTMDGPFWEHSRALLRPTFSRANIANLPAFEVHLQKFLKLLPRDGTSVDLKPLLCKLFIDTSTEFLFGESMNILNQKEPQRSQDFLDAFHYAQQGTGKRLQLGKLAFLYCDKKYYESIKVAHAFADYYVDKAIEYRRSHLADKGVNLETFSDEDASKHKVVLLHDMAMETDNREDLRNQILHVFLAGHESSAITIGNAIFQLCRNPDKWERLRTEVLALGNGTEHLTAEKLKGVKYLSSVIKETVRLYPVASMSTRKAYKDTVLPTGGGALGTSPVFVRKGTIISSSVYALHRISACWKPDPEAFRPERWEEGVKPGPSYMPFGWGVRTCPARYLAEIEIGYTLARMAQLYERIECRDEVSEWVEELRVSTSSRNGTKVALVPAPAAI
ncbi:putative cytochrome P450 alkane hydroxylase [Podospora didyma]|uniref:Cytochrome P450 alkane hydroxylase n=1 Tax=Podospora didyma TaxID=330526 RepID=A0AAE0K4H2_9PEZI|nr:putative cytochrome P450 alkane hydroxylase [Podospora didyma]